MLRNFSQDLNYKHIFRTDFAILLKYIEALAKSKLEGVLREGDRGTQ